MEDANLAFVKYVVQTGEILFSGSCPAADLDLQAQDPGFGVLEIAADRQVRVGEEYLVDGEIVERPTLAIEQEGPRFSNIPAGAIATIEGVRYPVDDGQLELSFEYPGSYQVRFECWPYRAAEFEIVA